MDIIIVKDEVKHEDDVILTINDDYNRMDHCEYVLPVPESEVLDYKIVKEGKISEDYLINYEHTA